MYVEQGYKGDIGLWKYFLIPLGFIGLMVLNYVAIKLLNLNVDAIMEAEISKKGANRFLIEMLLPFVVGLGLLFLWVKFVHKQSIKSLTTARKKVDWKRIFFAFGLWSLISVFLTGLDILILSPDDYVFNFNWELFIYLFFIAVLLIPIQTSFEEYLFRGYMMQGIGIMAKNRWLPLVVTSVLFGLMHLGNPEVEKLGLGIMVYYIGTGFFLGILTLMDDGLELALGFHAANNLITVLLVTADATAFQVDAIFKNTAELTLGWDVFIPIFVIFPILLFIFSKKYKWKDWEERLSGKIVSKEALITQNADYDKTKNT